MHSLQIDRNAPDAAWQLETARMSAAAAAPAPAQNPAPANDKNKVNIKKEVKKKPKVRLKIFYINRIPWKIFEQNNFHKHVLRRLKYFSDNGK